MSSITRELLNERQKTHGDFTENAEMSQALQRVCCTGSQFEHMTDVQKEAMRVICAKIARIMTGDCNHNDSWLDISGYAILAYDRIIPKPGEQ
jgi:hypothetical protein